MDSGVPEGFHQGRGIFWLDQAHTEGMRLLFCPPCLRQQAIDIRASGQEASLIIGRRHRPHQAPQFGVIDGNDHLRAHRGEQNNFALRPGALSVTLFDQQQANRLILVHQREAKKRLNSEILNVSHHLRKSGELRHVLRQPAVRLGRRLAH